MELLCITIDLITENGTMEIINDAKDENEKNLKFLLLSISSGLLLPSIMGLVL